MIEQPCLPQGETRQFLTKPCPRETLDQCHRAVSQKPPSVQWDIVPQSAGPIETNHHEGLIRAAVAEPIIEETHCPKRWQCPLTPLD